MPKIKVKGQTVQTGERPQTNGRTHGCYQTYYRPCYAVDNYLYAESRRIIVQAYDELTEFCGTMTVTARSLLPMRPE